jgi:hypothetical protein
VADPRRHPAHDVPLADRIITAEIAGWLDRKLTLALAANHRTGERRSGFEEAIEAMRHLHLSGVDYEVTPLIVGALRRAGLLAERGGGRG